ncbi:dicarboxylate/amino acid:cation symporter [Sporomusa termitida]|uniref:Proton/glutamate-aspartate symporter n=1 Tax=Sporomusa termitida TaxID=2377 RepID=A0A517DN40_9FIRM|nr:dicarboxylate/amino acid:cation symporter [Sporomusa termitida]QDR78768.1 Proton/glutamate-aspartate symporter [Sporomusa termitida]
MKQHQKLLLGFILGVVGGLFAYYVLPVKAYPFMQFITEIFTLVGAIFLRLIFMVVIPLLFSALILGVFELGVGRGLGKVATKSITYTLLLSAIAVIIAITLTGILQPGAGMEFDKAALNTNQSVIAIQKNVEAVQGKPWYQFFVELLPQNPLDSAVRAFQGEIIALMFFALIFGYALSLTVKDAAANPLIQVFKTVFDASLKVIDFAMKLAPYGIFGIVFNTAYKLGAGFLQNVAFYALVVVIGLLIQQFIVYAFFLKTVGKTSPWEFFKACREVYVYAFSTASSNATLPVALEVSEKVLKLPPRISRFVLTIGASANQNGTALFEGVTVLFLAQVYGIDLSIQSQVLVVLMSILAGVGTAGVPGGSLPLIVVLLTQVGIPPEGIGLILGVDRFLDMCRTTLNVSGDLVISKLVSASVTEADLADEQTATPGIGA